MTNATSGKRLVSLLFLLAVGAHAAPPETVAEARGPGGPLKGVLAPSDLAGGPAALIVPGSGPTDHDGNSALGVKASTYRLLAGDLAARGVTSVRIDKRGMFTSAAATADANAVTIDDYVTDVKQWVDVLRKRTGQHCVWLIGHSEGALVAMAAGKQDGVCGLVLVAAPGRPLGAILREQLAKNPANTPLLAPANAVIDALEKGERVDTSGLHPALQGLFRPQVQGFLINAFSYDPARLLAGYPKPVLIVQGTRDIQVGEADARLLKLANPGAVLALLPDVNHVLKAVTTDDTRANLAAYADPDLPLAPGVGTTIANFMRERQQK